jgi:transcription elongation GreA/GreB family factor
VIQKAELNGQCIALLQDRIASITGLIEDARNASNNDTKSSMGDKYETTREMMQIEINKLQLQLKDAQQMLLAFKTLDAEKRLDVVAVGAWVETDRATFYLAAAVGKVTFHSQTIMVVSPVSPIGKAMLGKRRGDTIAMGGVVYTVREVG